MADPKVIGMALALTSSVFIGVSFIITKKGLLDTAKKMGENGSHGYLQNYTWWIGLTCMITGEALNFAAYAFAPAILVTPLGAGSVFVSAILAIYFLDEHLSKEGWMGCGLCIIGSVIIILHSPEDPEIHTVEQVLGYAANPGFIVYVSLCIVISVYMVFWVAPIYGKSNMLVYITICSLCGSLSVMAAKGLGIGIRLSFEGNNQFVFWPTYVFFFVCIGCAVTQINYFNKALDQFSTNRVTPIYYVFFTTATIIASLILFQGFAGSTVTDIISAIAGFITIFIGVFMVNNSKASDANNKVESLARSARNSMHSMHSMHSILPLVNVDTKKLQTLRMRDPLHEPSRYSNESQNASPLIPFSHDSIELNDVAPKPAVKYDSSTGSMNVVTNLH